ncbi:helix-turn-helix domain-containing protein [Marinicauda pacifica]|jgi:transcriptional regulator with XRE-family HTH domain|uniref:helix-turn-helix domain-containing protein n=1 Tax=Marinicauda pacifica TaxID=1133559 RepID=UPI0035C78C44
MTSSEKWGLRLRAFRMRSQIKQEALARLLDISQAYVSRLEAGAVIPSDELTDRIKTLLRQRKNRPLFDDWRATVRHSTALMSLIRKDEGDIRVVEISDALRAASPAFEHVTEGTSVTTLLAPDSHKLVEELDAEGAFDGTIARARILWSAGDLDAEACFEAINLPVRDDMGRWYIHSTHTKVSRTDYKRWLQSNAGADVVIA